MVFLIYKIIPNKRVHFKSALQAALFTGLLWEMAKHLFAWYVVHLARYSIFYGSLSTLVIFVLWMYYSSTILVPGGEFAYFLEEDRQRSMEAVFEEDLRESDQIHLEEWKKRPLINHVKEWFTRLLAHWL